MPEKNAKSSGRVRRLFFSLLGQPRSKAFLAFLLNKKHKVPSLKFPVDVSSVKSVLIILPENHLLVLHQLRNVISLMSILKHATVTLLCERSAAMYIKMIPGINLVEYDLQDHYSKEFSEISQQFRGNIDLCFLLNESPDLPMLYLAGSTGAPVRVGYGDAGDSPFLNLHIRPSSQRKYLGDWYSAMAEMFGSKSGEIRWRVAQKTIEEVDHLIGELKINPDARLVGFDAIHFIRSFGIEWTDRFMHRVLELQAGTVYFHVEDTPREKELVWLCSQNVPSFADLSASRLAALINKSEFVISGNTPMFALAGLLQRPAFGFFRENEIERYCPQNNLLKGVTYSREPGNEEIDLLLGMISEMQHRRNVK
jgi:ADP-heptose:LPS heptosyltransferase